MSQPRYNPLLDPNSTGSDGLRRSRQVSSAGTTGGSLGMLILGITALVAIGALIAAAVIAAGSTDYQNSLKNMLFGIQTNVSLTREEIIDGQVCGPQVPRFPMENFVTEIDLTGKVFVITGGARGQARRLCETLKRDRNAIVICTSRYATGYPSAGLYQLPVFRPETAPDVDYLETLDLTSDISLAAFKTAVDGILLSLNKTKIDGLIMVSGRFCYGTIIGTALGGPSDIAKYMGCQEQDYHNVLRVLQTFWSLIPTTGYGRIVTYGSVGAWTRFGSGFSDYNSYKWAARTITDIYRFENYFAGVSNIRVSSINPGSIRTTIAVVNTTDPAGSFAIYTDIANTIATWKFFHLAHTTPLGISPQETANSVVQLLELTEPPAEIMTYPISNDLFVKGMFCGDVISKNDIWEQTPSLLIHRLLTAVGRPDPAHTVGILDPYENSTVPNSAYDVWFFVVPDESNSNYDLEYKIGAGAWSGAGGWTFGQYISQETITVGYTQYGYRQSINFAPFAGSFTTLCAKVITLSSVAVTPFYPEFCIDIKVA